MPDKPVDTYIFIAFLEHLGLQAVRSKESHEAWNREINPLDRPIIFRPSNKQIPPLHIRTNCLTLGWSVNDFWKWVEQNR
jgi:hypothetical protein